MKDSKYSLGWMESWTKKTLAQAAKAQEQIGELLTRPSKRYQELSDENSQLRRRVSEISRQIDNLSLSGKTSTGALQLVRGSEGFVLGTEMDKRLLEMEWFRKPPSTGWQPIASTGFYRANADDIDCLLRVKITFTPLFHRLFQELDKKEGEDQPPQKSDKDHRSKTEKEGIMLTRREAITVSDSVAALLAQQSSDAAQFVVENKSDLVHRYTLQLDFVKELTEECQMLRVQLQRSASQKNNHSSRLEEVDETATVSEGSIASDDEDEVLGEPSAGNFIAMVPGTKVRVVPDPLSDTAVTISVSEAGARTRVYTLFTSSNVQRDVLVLSLRAARASVEPASVEVSFDSWLAEKSASKVVGRTEADTNGETASSRSFAESNAEQATKVSSLSARECAYPEVWESLGYDFHSSESESQRSRGLSTSSSSLFRMTNKSVLKSMTSLLSTALDPASQEQQASPSPPPKDEMEEQVEFDLYKLAGFGDHFDVHVDLAEGEGLGISLSLFPLVKHADKGSKQLDWPRAGCSCVCVSEFCSIIVDGEECKGQLEQSNLIRPGDALVAISGMSVEKAPIKCRSDFLTYEPCSLSRVAALVKKVRQGKSTEQDEAEDERRHLPNPACKMTFTFAKGVSGQGKLVASQNKLKDTIDALKQKLYESDARMSTVVSGYERKLEKAVSQVHKLSDFVEQQRKDSEHALVEKLLAVEQLAAFQAKSATERDLMENELSVSKACVEQANKKSAQLESELDAARQRIARLEASMTEMAQEGEAWVNTIGTKEDAMRALEAELKVQVIKHENLQALLDGSTAQRKRLSEELEQKESAIESYQQEVYKLKAKLEAANDEADSLTTKMRLEAEEAENAVQRAQHEARKAQEETAAMRDQLAAALSTSKALKEASVHMEKRVEEACTARQQAEVALREERSTVSQLRAQMDALKQQMEQLTSAAELKQSSAHDGSEDEIRARIAEVESANAVLRAQVKTFKSKVQSLSAEASKAAQLDQVMAEKNDLLVQVQLEKAQRLEAEDELSAYKRALMQFAEQARKSEEEGNGQQWSNRPAIFDHLYKRQLSDQKR